MTTVVTDAGRAITTNRLKGSGTEPAYIGWGTGAGTAAVADTALFTEASETRVAGTSTRVTTSVANDTYQVVGTLTADGTKTVTNVGLLDAVSSGNLFLHGDFTGVPLLVGEAIEFTLKAQYN